MDKENELLKSLISPSGDTLQEHLDFIGMKPQELAERMNLPKDIMNNLIRGKEQLTTEIACKLEKELQIPSSFWINREHDYRQELNEINSKRL